MARGHLDFSRFIADASGLAALGTIAADLIGLGIPHRVSEGALGLLGAVAGLLIAVILHTLLGGESLDELLDRLVTADLLFLRGILNEYEWRDFRSLSLRKY